MASSQIPYFRSAYSFQVVFALYLRKDQMSHAISNVIKEVLIKELMVNVPLDKINDEDSFQSVLGLDSLSFAELRYQCESRFNIDIADEYFVPDYFNNLKNLVSLIVKLQAEQTSAVS